MTEPLEFVTLDVFTDQPFLGNPLAVVLGADTLSTAQMQTIAREFNLSETIFVMAPQDAGHTARVRIFFPTAEIPFAGHPTIGCAIHLASAANPEGDFEALITLEEEAGLVPVNVVRTGRAIRAEFKAPVLPHAPDLGQTPDNDRIAAALGLSAEAIGMPGHRPAVWQGGPAFLFVPLRDSDALEQAKPHEPAWSEIMGTAAVDSAYLYTDCQHTSVADYEARMFSPTAGIPEDPATGSASALLAAQLLDSGVLKDGTQKLRLRQGLQMGRASHITLTASCAQGALTDIRIAGSAVAIARGQITVPQQSRD
ncbi:PhzF family phenazine biosynthesis protein [Thalassococcus lentus]|uniref:PhzF family phenazine biosynthesis protein n=1 Tax=Thalassococcus lentus TaxID=1210524 RepID=A0ABT4XVZ0_9RHOB|nr:PhzF family phenazine biosynthesis protein [Thalassococcus lentus]MDA7426106.1 PhzF family phenazine biosynthesis protein [Thalassococcus lentus]